MKLNFCSLSSGSSGNCYYLGNGSQGILIDAGISAASIRKFLRDLGIPMETIMGILITHNHSDHIKGLEVLTRRNGIPAFTTCGVWKSILSPRTRITSDCIREITTGSGFSIAGFDIEAFPVCHDAPETVGYRISSEGRNVTIATDLGHVCETSAPYIRSANLLVIESNYDEEMLAGGTYPYFLKSRIKSDHGHLGNHQASSFLADIINDDLRVICLAHLSINNNTPDKALNTLQRTLSEKGISPNGNLKITVLDRHRPSEMIWLE
ncbi:MAG: MBL fold metallo-hydrolase [Bacteroidales bacterium]